MSDLGAAEPIERGVLSTREQKLARDLSRATRYRNSKTAFDNPLFFQRKGTPAESDCAAVILNLAAGEPPANLWMHDVLRFHERVAIPNGDLMPTLLRYLFFQIPGWVIAVVVAAGLLRWDIVPFWLAVLGVAGWVVKDLAFYPVLRSAYEAHVKSGSEALVGKKGIVQGDLAPEGYVRVHGELWRASADPSAPVILSGSEVEVVRAEGMRLFVRAQRRG